MAWSESLLDCSFRGFVFDVLRTDDSAERSTAEHAYPYVDGSDIEDLGRGSRRVSIEAMLWEGLRSLDATTSAMASGYEDRLHDLLQVLDQRGAGELIHPIFGSMLVQVARYQVHHDADGVDQCTVSVEFVETTGSDKPFFERDLASQRVDVITYQSGIALGALAGALANLIDALRNSNSLATLNSLRQQMLGPILATLSQTQGVLLSGLDVLVFPRAWANDISSIVDGVLNLRDFGDTLIADWTAIGNALGLFDVFSNSGSNSVPVQICTGVTPTEAQAVAATQAHLAATTAIGIADCAAAVLGAEADPQHGATLSPPEIEGVTNIARTRIEAAIAAIRAIYPLETARTITEPLKSQALALQEAARAIIEARPPLVGKSIEAPGNLRLVAHRWYGDHTRAPELARLNPGLRLTNNLQFGDVINAYAQ